MIPDPAGQAREIWQYRFKGETVYYVPPEPYDIPGTLYNSDGEIICSPDSGLTGYGDERCPDFFKNRRGGTLIWKIGQNVPSREWNDGYWLGADAVHRPDAQELRAMLVLSGN